MDLIDFKCQSYDNAANVGTVQHTDIVLPGLSFVRLCLCNVYLL